MARLPLLLALTCLGSGAGLVAGRALLTWIPAADPQISSSSLKGLAWLSPDPERRREARLLLVQRQGNDPAGERVLLRGQGWGRDSIAALVLKRDALAAEALGDPATTQQRWQHLLRRFPQTPSAADGLYALGRQRPELRQELLRRFAAHPAALAAALEAGPAPAARLEGALHLARHGVRWPGAEPRLRQACQSRTAQPTPAQRDQLAAGLAQLSNGEAALNCLQASLHLWNHARFQGWNEFSQFSTHAVAVVVGLVAVNNGAERIGRQCIKQNVYSHQIARAIPRKFVVQTGVTLRAALQLIKEINHNFGKWHGVLHIHALWRQVLQLDKFAAALLAQLHKRTRVFLLRNNADSEKRLFN